MISALVAISIYAAITIVVWLAVKAFIFAFDAAGERDKREF